MINQTVLGGFPMKAKKKRNYALYDDNAPGIAGVFCSILANILGPVVFILILCFALNVCFRFVGVDFDCFVWLQEFAEGLPTQIEQWIADFPIMIQTLIFTFEDLKASISGIG